MVWPWPTIAAVRRVTMSSRASHTRPDRVCALVAVRTDARWVDAATYELDLDIAGERRELAVRIGRSEITDVVARAPLESFVRAALRAL